MHFRCGRRFALVLASTLFVPMAGLASSVEPPSSGPALAIISEMDNLTIVSPQLAVAPNGEAFAAWVMLGQSSLGANRYVPGAGWGTPARLDSRSAFSDPFSPRIAIDGFGNATVAWYHLSGPGGVPGVWASRFSGGGWGPATVVGRPQYLGTNVRGDSFGVADPQVAMAANGDAIVVWAAAGKVQANRYAAGQGWVGSTMIGPSDRTEVSSLRVAVSPGGNGIATWKAGESLWYNRFSPADGWGYPAEIATQEALGSVPRETRLGMAPDGRALLFWVDGAGASISYTPGKGWGTVSRTEAVQGAFSGSPALAMDATGNATAVWVGGEWTLTDIYAARHSERSGWSPVTRLELNDTVNAFSPHVSVDASGAASAAWIQSDGAQPSVWWARRGGGGGWTTPELAEAYSEGDARALDIGSDLAGNVLVVWSRTVPGTGGDVAASWLPRGASPPAPPELHIKGLPASIPAGMVRVEGTASSDRELAGVLVRMDDGAWILANGTETWWAELDVLPGEHLVTVRAVSGDGIATEAFQGFRVEAPPVTPAPNGEQPLPPTTVAGVEGDSLVAAISIVTLIALVGSLGTSRANEALAGAFFLPLFTRLRRDEVRHQVNRGRLLQFIEDHPGANFTLLRRRLSLSNGACAYHLQVLERSGEIRRVAEGASVRFYTAGYRFDAEALPPLAYMQRRILESLISLRVASFSRIHEDLGSRGVQITEKNLGYHLRVLAREKGIIETSREGRLTFYYIDDEKSRGLLARLRDEAGFDEALGSVAMADASQDPWDLVPETVFGQVSVSLTDYDVPGPALGGAKPRAPKGRLG